MGSLVSLIFIILSFASLKQMTSTKTQEIRSARLLDLVIRDYTFQSYANYFGTGKLHTIHLPANLSGINVTTIRFRCGSLKRYGANFKEFHLDIGILVQPCEERVLVVTQNLGHNWSSIYYDNYELTGYRLISPILGLLAYNAGDDMNFSTPFEIKIQAKKKPITIDFSNTTRLVNSAADIRPVCASFGHDGKVTLSDQVSQNVCLAMGHGHFGLVVQPANVPNSFKQRAMLVDEIWHAAGDEASDIDWYVKRTVLAGIYSTTEIYMLTDASLDFRDTWAFLNGRVRDAFDFKKSIQEATYLAEAIGAGMGSSVQGFMKSVFKN